MTAISSPETAPRVLIAGCGDLGCALARQLLADGLQVHGLRRRPAALPQGVAQLAGDVAQPQTLGGLAAVAPQLLVYAVAAGAQSDDEYRTSYVDGLRNVLEALRPAGTLRHVLFVSSTRVYGQPTDALLDESTPAEPADFGGRRLLQAEQLLLQAPCPASALRLSGIYGPGRTRLLELSLQPPQQWPANSWSNRIHRDDAASFIALLARRAMQGEMLERCYIVSDDVPAPLHEVLRWLAEQQGMNLQGIPLPPVAGGKRVSNARLRATGYHLRYPDYRTGYGELLDLPR